MEESKKIKSVEKGKKPEESPSRIQVGGVFFFFFFTVLFFF